jgi:hypothetical protein
MEYTVRINGRPVKKFQDKEDAQKFMVWFSQDLKAQEMRWKLIDEAVEKSDMAESKSVLAAIMEKR